MANEKQVEESRNSLEERLRSASEQREEHLRKQLERLKEHVSSFCIDLCGFEILCSALACWCSLNLFSVILLVQNAKISVN